MLSLEPLAPACVEYSWPPEADHGALREPGGHLRLLSAMRADTGGELVIDDEELWADHREAAAGLTSRRVLPADAYAEIERLQSAGATRVVGRIARGHVLSDAAVPADVELTPLEQRVMAAYGG